MLKEMLTVGYKKFGIFRQEYLTGLSKPGDRLSVKTYVLKEYDRVAQRGDHSLPNSCMHGLKTDFK